MWKQVRKCLSLDNDDDVTVSLSVRLHRRRPFTKASLQPVPSFLFEPIRQFMITNPEDDEFVIECHVPGSDTSEFGVITCMWILGPGHWKPY